MSLNKRYNIIDYLRCDDGKTDKSAIYSTINLNSLTHNPDGYYEAYRSLNESPVNTYYSLIYIDEDLPSDYEISVDYNVSRIDSSIQYEIQISNIRNNTYQGASAYGLLHTYRASWYERINGAISGLDTQQIISTNAWFTFKVAKKGSIMTTTIMDAEGNVLYNKEGTISQISFKKWNIVLGGNSTTLKWKNLKIKPL